MSNLESMHEKASKLYEEKKLEEALKIYNDIILQNPFDEVALSCSMDIYLELDDKMNYYLARANVNISQGKLDFAINDTKKALECDLDNTITRLKLARLYKANNKNLKAIDEYLKLLEISDKELNAYFELAELYMKENSIDSAISIAKQGLDIFSDNINLKNMLAQLYFKANDFENALKVVQDEIFKIKILLQDEQNDEAKKLLDAINYQNLDDEKKKSYHILKAQYFYNTSNYQDSIQEVEDYTRLSGPDAISFQMKALNYEELDNEFEAHFNWGFCYKFQNKLDEAIVEFDNAYKVNPENKTVLIELANLYTINGENFVAVEFWQKVYDIDKDEQAKEVLAEFYYAQGDFERAQMYGKTKETKNKEVLQENYVGLLDRIMNFFSKDGN